MTDYDAVVFDNDGVLVEPPARERRLAAAREAFRSVGVDDPDDEHVHGVVEGVTPDRVAAICDAYGVELAEFWQARERCDERSQVADFENGVRERYDDVSALASLECPRAVVSNNHHSTVAFVLDFFGLASTFDTYYGRPKTLDSLTDKKPDPHYLQRALAELDAGAALFVGDSESDVLAADRAGVDSAFVRRPHCRDVALDVDPTYDVADLRAVVEIVTGET